MDCAWRQVGDNGVYERSERGAASAVAEPLALERSLGVARM